MQNDRISNQSKEANIIYMANQIDGVDDSVNMYTLCKLSQHIESLVTFALRLPPPPAEDLFL